MNRAVFIDRDDTINRDVPYCSHPDDFELLPGVAEGIKLLNRCGLKVVIVTNQSGIARGYFTQKMLKRIHNKMKDELKKRGAFIDGIYYCPHHPDDHCKCRKPEPGLILRAAEDMGIDLPNSYVVGDKLQDVEAGKKAGCTTILVSAQKHTKGSNIAGHDMQPDFLCADLQQAAEWILRRVDRKREVDRIR